MAAGVEVARDESDGALLGDDRLSGIGRAGGVSVRATGEAAGHRGENECGGGEDSGVLCVFHASTVTTLGMNARRHRYGRGMNAGTLSLTGASAPPTLQV
jgi:hypothetical protein